MKVNTKVTFVWDKAKGEYIEESAEFYVYEGEVAHAGGGGGTETTTQTTAPWEGQQPYLEDLFRQAQQYFQGGPADLSRATNVATRGAEAYEQGAGAIGDIAGQAANAQRFLLSGDVLSPGANPALQQYIDLANQSTTRAFRQGGLQAIDAGAVQAGNVGSSRQGIAQGLGLQGLSQQIGQQTAGLSSAAYGQGLQAYVQGLGLAGQTADLQMGRGRALSQAGNAFAGIANLPQQQQLEMLQNYRDLISGQPGGTSTRTGPGYETGGISGALGGAGVGYTIGGGWGAGLGAVAGYFS